MTALPTAISERKRKKMGRLKKELFDWAYKLSDDELKDEYYDAVYDSLGSITEEMYERGYDIQDIIEREQYEKELRVKVNVLESVCNLRGINLWDKSH